MLVSTPSVIQKEIERLTEEKRINQELLQSSTEEGAILFLQSLVEYCDTNILDLKEQLNAQS